MSRAALVLSLALPAALAACGSSHASAPPAPAAGGTSIRTASGLVRAMRARYGEGWYRTLTFVQTTTFHTPDGPQQETWYEAARLPGRLRIDLPEPDSGNAVLFRGDSTYVFQRGALVQARPEGNPLLLFGFDVYSLPPDETGAGMARLGIDTSAIRADVWEGRPAWVVGAAPGDATSPQVWFDQERLVFVRLIERGGPDGRRVQDIRFERYERLAGGWIAPHVAVYVDGRLVMEEDYADVRADVALDPATFSPTGWRAVRWWE